MTARDDKRGAAIEELRFFIRNRDSRSPSIAQMEEWIKLLQTTPSHARRSERDYCEACGYTDSHDPNCPAPAPKHFIAPCPLPQELVASLIHYDAVTAKAETAEWDFVMTAADWRVIRDFFKTLKPGGAPTVIENPPRPA